MLFIGATIGSVLICALIAIGMVANWVSGQSLGTTEPIYVFSYETSWSQLGGFVSLFADGLKWLLPFFIVAAWKNKEKAAAFGLAAIFSFCLAWGIYSAVSFVMIGSEHLEASAEQSKESRESIVAKIKKKEEQRKLVPVHRELAIVQTELANKKTSREWDWAEGCAKPQFAPKFCEGYRGLLAEEASASAAEKLDDEISVLEAKRDGKSNIKEVNPLAAQIAHVLGTDKANVYSGRGVAFALFIEIVSAFGLVLLWRARGDEKVIDKLPALYRPRRTELVAIPEPTVWKMTLPKEEVIAPDPVPTLAEPGESAPVKSEPEKEPDNAEPSPQEVKAEVKRERKAAKRLGRGVAKNNVVPFGEANLARIVEEIASENGGKAYFTEVAARVDIDHQRLRALLKQNFRPLRDASKAGRPTYYRIGGGRAQAISA